MNINNSTYVSLYSLFTKNYSAADIFKAPTKDENSFNAANSEAASYKTDTDGFLDNGFNRSVGIPDNIKIHPKVLERMEKYSEASGSVDLTQEVSDLWRLFNQLTNNIYSKSKDGTMTVEQYKENVSTGLMYSYDKGVYKTYSMKETMQADEALQNGSSSMLSTPYHLFSSWEVAQDGSKAFDDIRQIFKDYTGAEAPKESDQNNLSIDTLFNNFMVQMTTPMGDTKKQADIQSLNYGILSGNLSAMALANKLKMMGDIYSNDKDNDLSLLPEFAANTKEKLEKMYGSSNNAKNSVNINA